MKMNKELQSILAPARAIVAPVPVVVDPPKENLRTYYLFKSGKVSQRKVLTSVLDAVMKTCRAKTTGGALNIFAAGGGIPFEGRKQNGKG